MRQEHPFGFAVLKHPEAGGVMVASDVKDRWIYATKLDVPRETPADFTEERWTRLIRLATGLPELTPKLLGTFPWEAAGSAWRSASPRAECSWPGCRAPDAAHRLPRRQHRHPGRGQPGLEARGGAEGHAGPSLLETYDSDAARSPPRPRTRPPSSRCVSRRDP